MPIADEAADALLQARAQLSRAGRILHDDVAPLLSAAGLRLQILRMDFPESGNTSQQVMEVLDDAMERLRALSQSLNPSPVARAGLKHALSRLIEARSMEFPGKIKFAYDSPDNPPEKIAEGIYDATAAALINALQHANVTLIQVSVRGSKKMRVRIKDNGTESGAQRKLALPALLARRAGLTFEVSTGRGTIVDISRIV